MTPNISQTHFRRLQSVAFSCIVGGRLGCLIPRQWQNYHNSWEQCQGEPSIGNSSCLNRCFDLSKLCLSVFRHVWGAEMTGIIRTPCSAKSVVRPAPDHGGSAGKGNLDNWWWMVNLSYWVWYIVPWQRLRHPGSHNWCLKKLRTY